MNGNGLSVAELVGLARNGDKAAWDELVERFAPLVWSVCLKFGLAREDIEEASQNVWLAMIEELVNLREPAALAGWLATTTRRECLRVATARRRRQTRELHQDDDAFVMNDGTDIEAQLLAEERDHALREAFGQLPPHCQELLELLMVVPRLSYAEIGRRLTMPVGGIGPNRARCLDKLKRCPALAQWLEAPEVRCAE
jgi:RNA polymerase sigma factor (sigma-70 family)